MDNSAGSSSKSSAWSFGTLVKSLTSKSEEVLQAYQRDLQEFGLGLRREGAVAADVVKDLPGTLESTAAVAQESLEAVGQSIEEFSSSVWRGTAEIIGQVKEAVKKVEEQAAESSENPQTGQRYSRYEAQLHAMECDRSTYCDEPEDKDDYLAWRSSFDLDARKDDTKSLLEEHSLIQGFHASLVPEEIDENTFWLRYFYRLNKLQQAEDARADLVKRATAEEDELSWEVDEDNDGTGDFQPAEPPVLVKPVEPSVPEGAQDDEARSEGKSDNSSSGTEWLVVQEEREEEVTPKSVEGKAMQTDSARKNGNSGSPEERDDDWSEWE